MKTKHAPTEKEFNDMLRQAAEFSNFAQKLKMVVWARQGQLKSGVELNEDDLDAIARSMFDWLKL